MLLIGLIKRKFNFGRCSTLPHASVWVCSTDTGWPERIAGEECDEIWAACGGDCCANGCATVWAATYRGASVVGKCVVVVLWAVGRLDAQLKDNHRMICYNIYNTYHN